MKKIFIFIFLLVLIPLNNTFATTSNKIVEFKIWDSYLVTWWWDTSIIKADSFKKNNGYLNWWLAPTITIYYWHENNFYRHLGTFLLPEWKWSMKSEDGYRVLWERLTFWIKLLSQVDNKSFKLDILKRGDFDLNIKKINISDYEVSNNITCVYDFQDWINDSWNWFRYEGKWFYNIGNLFCFWKEKIKFAYRFCDKNNSWMSDLWNGFFSDKWVLCLLNSALIEKEWFLRKTSNLYICSKNSSCSWGEFNGISVSNFKFIWERQKSKYISIWDKVYRWTKLLDKFVYRWIKLVENVTAKWFEVLSKMHYKDQNNVFYNDIIIEWANTKDFKALNSLWWADKENLYVWTNSLNVKFDYDSVTNVSYDILADKNRWYTKNWIISHREVSKIEWKSFDELWLGFPAKIDYSYYVYLALWIIWFLLLTYFSIKIRGNIINILYYIYTMFVLCIWLTWYYNYAITDKKRLGKDSLSWISDLFWEYVIFPTFPMNSIVAYNTYWKIYLFWFIPNIYFQITLIIFSLLWIYALIRNRKNWLNYIFLVLLIIGTIFIIHMLVSFLFSYWEHSFKFSF